MDKFSLSFFRKYFRIPRAIKLHWCILVEHEEGRERQRLGVMLCGTDRVIDVATRKFVQTGLPTPVSYSSESAVRHTDEDEFVFYAGDRRLRLPNTYVDDIYFRCVYSEEMMNQPLI